MRKFIPVLFSVLFLTGCGREIPQSLYQVPTLIVREGSESGFDLSVYKKDPGTQLRVMDHPELNVRFVPAADSLYISTRDGVAPLVNLVVKADGVPYDIIVKIRKMVKHTFTYPVNPGDSLVVVMGGFNDWSRTALPLTDEDGDGILERTVYLNPERIEYKFVVNWQELIDPGNPVFVSNNIGGWNSILDLSNMRPSAPGRFIKRTAHGKRLEFGYVSPADGAKPVLLSVLVDNTLLTDQEVDQGSDGSLTVNSAGWKNGLLRITGIDGSGRAITENQTILRNGKPLNPESSPENWHFTTLYSIMVDRFLDGDEGNTVTVDDPELHPLANFHGGDLAGIIARLKDGYFEKLGIKALWISPVSRQPEGAWREWIPPNRKFTGYHGYWPVEPREIDPRFGTEAEFHELVNEAHRRDIKVILDFVSNHVHQEHVYNKSNPEWFGAMTLPDGTVNIRNWSEETRLTTWFDEFIPSYDFPAAPEAVDQVVEDAIWWLETFDLDGFRQDAVKHVPHVFWKKLTAEMKSRYPEKEFYQIGETFGSDDLIGSYVNPGELNSQFNFSIYFNARIPFSANNGDFSHIATILDNNPDAFGQVNLMGNITSSHDQVRFMSLADGQLTLNDNGTERAFNDPPGAVRNLTSYDKLLNFTAFNLSLTGVPVIYYGEEIGLMGASDPGNRRPMRFGTDISEAEERTLNLTAKLTELRNTYPSLSVGDYLPLLVNGPIFVYAKLYFDETILVAFNQGSKYQKLFIQPPVAFSTASDLLDKNPVSLSGSHLDIDIPAYGRRIIKLD